MTTTETGQQKTLNVVALNADIVGFSQLMADNPATTATRVKELAAVVETQVSEHSGTLVNFVGDNFMAVFDNAVDGVAAAIGIGALTDELNLDRPAQEWIRFRFGIDQGEASWHGQDIFGDALNIAARIQSKAKPGGLSVSSRVYRALDEPKLRFRSTGQHNLRNIPEPVEIFELTSRNELDRAVGDTSSRTFRLAAPTIAVLPLISSGVSDPVRQTAEVFRSDLIHGLSNIPNLGLIEASSLDATSGTSAQYMLETGVMEVGSNVRIYTKLIELATLNFVNSHKWATTVEAMYENLDGMIDEVIRRIEVELVVGERANFYDMINDPEVMRRVYQGWYELMTPSRTSWNRARQLFDEAVELQPDFIYTRVIQAFTNWVGAAEGYSHDPAASLELARQQAEVVAEMGDPTGLAGMIRAAVSLDRGDPDQALDIIEKVQITRPTCDLTFALEGSIRRYLGQWEKSVSLIDTAMSLAAVTPPWYPTVQACSLFLGDRLDAAGTITEEVIEHYPNNLEALMVLTAVQAEMGLTRRARATGAVIRDRFPAIDLQEWLTHHPYQDPAVIQRWRRALVLAGLLDETESE